jgi:hypothetical protein
MKLSEIENNARFIEDFTYFPDDSSRLAVDTLKLIKLVRVQREVLKAYAQTEHVPLSPSKQALAQFSALGFEEE